MALPVQVCFSCFRIQALFLERQEGAADSNLSAVYQRKDWQESYRYAGGLKLKEGK